MIFILLVCTLVLSSTLSEANSIEVACNARQSIVTGSGYATVEDILEDEKYVKFQIKCLRKQGPCNTTGKKIQSKFTHTIH